MTTPVGASVQPRPEWMASGLCAQVDPDLWFPEKGGSTRDAKRICNRCVCRPRCLKYALDHNEKFGIWGATTERERRELRRKQGKPEGGLSRE